MPDGTVLYFVKWVNHSIVDACWVDSREMRCDELVANFEAECPGEVEFIIEKALRRGRSVGGKIIYEVQWAAGYELGKTTWEPVENLPLASLEAFETKLALIDEIHA